MKNLTQYGWLLTACLIALAIARPLTAQVASHAPTVVAAQPSTAFSMTPAPTVSGKPVARVNGVVMTDRDLLREMYTIFPYARQHNGFPKAMEADIRKGALQMIIFEELVYQEAQRQKTAVTNERINKALFEFKKKFATREEYESYLQSEAAGSEQFVKDRIRRSLMVDAYLKAQVHDKSVVSLTGARAYYDKHPERFSYKESIAFQSISIMPPEKASPEVMKDARRRAEEALQKAKATKSYKEFGLLAEKISEDDFRVNMGDHHAVERDQLPPEVVKAAETMKTGDVSPIITMGSTFTFFRLNEHVPAGLRKFDEVKGQLQKDLQKEKEDRLRMALDARLRHTGKVEVL